MSYQYILHATAQKDYEDALKWYAERSLKATENFIRSVDDSLSLICEHPVRWRNEYKYFYELGVKKFPYTIYTNNTMGRSVCIVFVGWA